jgi:osmotically-inducible protein OsmY
MSGKTAPILAAAVTALLLVVPSAKAADQPPAIDLTQMFRDGGVAVEDLRVVEIGGIVLIRGRATDRVQAEQAGAFATANGFRRVANLVQLVEPVDDAFIERAAERALSRDRTFDDCKLRIASRGGVVHLGGLVHEDLQRDLAVRLIRDINGVKSVQADLR